MEVTPSVPETIEPKKILQLDILSFVKSSQTQNGLRNNDYQRYRLYCNRRLRRVRSSLNLSCGRKFVKKTLDPSTFSDAKYLFLPLVCAERAWSYAMQLRAENTSGDSRVRMHTLRKLQKAVKYSKELVEACNLTADSKTTLEAEAYAAWMNANNLLEREQFKEALENFVRSRTVYSELAKLNEANRALFQQKCEEIDPSIRYCQYSLQRMEGDVSLDDIQSLAAGEGPGMDILKSKLEAVLEESRIKQAATLTEVSWQGKSIGVTNERVRGQLLAADQKIAELAHADTLDKKTEAYEGLFAAYNEALRIIREDAKGEGSSGKKPQAVDSQVKALQGYIQFQQLAHTTNRNLLLAENLVQTIDALRRGTLTMKEKKQPSPTDVVKLFETLAQNLDEMRELGVLEAGSDLFKEVAAKEASFKAMRCFWLGESYAAVSKWGEALVLYNRAEEHTTTASSMPCLPKEYVEKLRQLGERIRVSRCVVRSQNILSSSEEQKKLVQSVQSVSLSDQKSAEVQAPLLSRLDTYDDSEAAWSRLTPFPPEFEVIPTKPVLFDMAGNMLEFPDLKSRFKEEKKGGLFGFFRR